MAALICENAASSVSYSSRGERIVASPFGPTQRALAGVAAQNQAENQARILAADYCARANSGCATQLCIFVQDAIDVGAPTFETLPTGTQNETAMYAVANVKITGHCTCVS